jgi:hypothetical protein
MMTAVETKTQYESNLLVVIDYMTNFVVWYDVIENFEANDAVI